nr:MAG TPA: Putative golgin subfamily A member 2-like protein 5 [Caudoviricetes sp.]
MPFYLVLWVNNGAKIVVIYCCLKDSSLCNE